MEHRDVLIVGAGISGIGTAHYLRERCPTKTWAILEGREDIGGTWDLFRYPGIRSDSDMHTLGYSFKPWKAAKAIADGPAIKAYLEETVEEEDIRPHIRFQHHVTHAAWSREAQHWVVTATRKDTGETVKLSCNMLAMCAGYYSYKGGHKPVFEGQGSFEGPVIHPQEWPEDLDYKGKRVAIIGSGATAMTLVPAMAKDAEHVVMVQRSPTYVVSRPDQDWIANTLRKVLPEKLAYGITRFKNIAMQGFFYGQTRNKPEKVKKKLLDMARKELGAEVVEKHFTPKYNPWDQRLCLIPNSDLFESIKDESASVITQEIERFTPRGIKLSNGEHVDADIIVTATGLRLAVLGEIEFALDEEQIDFGKTWSYKGLMYSGVPNLISTFGYINASWTLRADLTAEYLCRVLNHLEKTGTAVCTPQLRESDQGMPARDWIEDFPAGYMQRAMHLFPKQGDRAPWLNTQDYKRDKKLFRDGPIEDGCLQFSGTPGGLGTSSGGASDSAESADQGAVLSAVG